MFQLGLNFVDMKLLLYLYLSLNITNKKVGRLITGTVNFCFSFLNILHVPCHIYNPFLFHVADTSNISHVSAFYFSIDKVPKITCPVLVIHGTEDEVIDFSHGLAIYEKCPRAVEPLWVEGAGHNDVELYGQYLERLKQFINIELSVN